ncbi:hypothetical protein JCM1840_000404 [Sporobolomyces johnsonii]
MAPLVITMVRHGESADNLTALWAGHRDAPLTNHGNNQATRLAKALENVPITAIYASDLKRAHTTAKRVWDANKTSPKPPFTVSPLLREQFFGEAEGAPWDAGKYSSAHLPWEDHRAFRLAPNAESLNDVARRADQVLRHFVLPHLLATKDVPPTAVFPEQHHIVLFAHGIWLSEMLFALKRAGDPHIRFVKSSSYSNTGFTTVHVELEEPHIDHGLPAHPPSLAGGDGSANIPEDDDEALTSPPAPSEAAASPPATGTTTTTTSASADVRPPLPQEYHSLLPTLPPVPPRDPALPPPYTGISVPRLRHRVVAFNQAEHLVGLKRTGGGVGSSEFDEKQRGLREFFAGGGGAGGEAKA